jgi:hypothetical protein
VSTEVAANPGFQAWIATASSVSAEDAVRGELAFESHVDRTVCGHAITGRSAHIDQRFAVGRFRGGQSARLAPASSKDEYGPSVSPSGHHV